MINLNDLANALKPVFCPASGCPPGEDRGRAGQGVGYLDDGTMVVVEGGRDHINESVTISVTSVCRPDHGRMVFGRVEAPGRPAEGALSRAR